MRITLPLIALALCFSVTGCGTTNQRATAADTRMAMPAAADAASMSDPQLLHIFVTANNGEVMTSEPFLAAFASDDVRAFAQMMVTDHTAANQRAMALGMTPVDNPMSMMMAREAQATTARLRTMSGTNLDMAYMEAQIQMHEQTLANLDNVLIPNADNAQERALFQQARPTVAMHLERAQAIHHSMM